MPEKNIVLIGLSGSGKTVFSKTIAAQYKMTCVDMDSEIVRIAGKPISKIFAEDGEKTFRDLETECAKKCGEMKGTVISTGGGVILREENMDALRKNAWVIFLDRAPEEIIGEDLSDRPLVADDHQKIYRLREQRLPLYQKYADITVRNCKEKADTEKAVLAAMKELMSR